MKNALAIYIDALASYAAANGRLPPRAADPSALRPVWESLRSQLADALEEAQIKAVAAEIVSSSPRALAALAEDGAAFGPIVEALDKVRAKTAVPSALKSADWELVPAQIREVSQFSAGVASARVMGAIQRRLESDAAWDFSVPSGREAFLRDMREVMETEGVGRETSGEGSITNPRANSRLGLIYDQQTRSARGYAARKIAMDHDMLDAVPAQELIRESEPKGGAAARRPWARIWREKGGVIRGGRMAALKTDPIWSAISRFGVPWPPFDFGSHMGLRDIFRSEAVELGLLAEDETVEPEPVPDYGAAQQAGVEDIPEALLPWLRSAFGERLEIKDGTATLLPKARG